MRWPLGVVVTVALALCAGAAPSCGFETRDFGGDVVPGDAVAVPDAGASPDADDVPPPSEDALDVDETSGQAP